MTPGTDSTSASSQKERPARYNNQPSPAVINSRPGVLCQYDNTSMSWVATGCLCA